MEGGSIVGRMFVQLLTGTAGINHRRIFLWQATWGKQENRRLLREIFTSFAFNVANWPPAFCSSPSPPPPCWQDNLLLPFVHIFFMCCEPFIDISLALCVKLLAAPLEISPFAFDGRTERAKSRKKKGREREREGKRESRKKTSINFASELGNASGVSNGRSSSSSGKTALRS